MCQRDRRLEFSYLLHRVGIHKRCLLYNESLVPWRLGVMLGRYSQRDVKRTSVIGKVLEETDLWSSGLCKTVCQDVMYWKRFNAGQTEAFSGWMRTIHSPTTTETLLPENFGHTFFNKLEQWEHTQCAATILYMIIILWNTCSVWPPCYTWRLHGGNACSMWPPCYIWQLHNGNISSVWLPCYILLSCNGNSFSVRLPLLYIASCGKNELNKLCFHFTFYHTGLVSHVKQWNLSAWVRRLGKGCKYIIEHSTLSSVAMEDPSVTV